MGLVTVEQCVLMTYSLWRKLWGLQQVHVHYRLLIDSQMFFFCLKDLFKRSADHPSQQKDHSH